MEKMKQANGKNQNGTVLLAVVCMGMFCMTLATIALSVVNYTNGATARNVMRAQAKVTAEACLAEFIGQYAEAGGGTADYEKLEALANSHDINNPYVIDVNPGDDQFATNYGTTKIKIYKEASGGFKVTSECTYGGTGYLTPQTQTASVKFAAASATPQIVNDVLEASEGLDNITEIGAPIDGDIHIERKRKENGQLEPDTLVNLGSQDVTYNSHVYSEYSLLFSNQVVFEDVVNKTGTLNYQPNATTKKGDYFYQAPVVWTEGYLCAYNSFTVKTSKDVGKTDVNLYNNWSATNAGVAYEKDNLENMDGFVYIGQQLMLLGSTAGNFHIGSVEDSTIMPIDVYCGGFYLGHCMEKTKDNTTDYGINDHYKDANAVKDKDGKSVINGGDTATFSMYGNLYVYSNGQSNTNPYSKPGSMYLLNHAGTCTINGDLFVENDLYIEHYTNEEVKLIVNGDLHVGGNIYIVKRDGDYMVVDTNKKGTITDGNLPDCATKFIEVNGGTIDNQVDTAGASSPRNAKPQQGYNASTGIESSSRTYLRDAYADASTNTIFAASLDPLHQYNSEAKDIARKYAEAMATPLSTPKYMDKNNAVKDLTTKYGSGNYAVVEINSSCRFTSSDFKWSGIESKDGLAKYSVKLTNEDIVIALPLDSAVLPAIRIDSTQRTEDVFVYFVFYTTNGFNDNTSTNTVTINNCLYLSSETPITKEINVDNVYNTSTNSFVTKKVILGSTKEADRSSYKVDFTSTACTMTLIADYELYFPYEDDGSGTERKVTLDKMSSLYDRVSYANISKPSSAFQNYIIYYVPDNVNFRVGGPLDIQGIVYAPQSNVYLEGSYPRIIGQVKCKRYKFGQDTKEKMLIQLPVAEGSIVDYVGAANSSVTSVDIQYYEY